MSFPTPRYCVGQQVYSAHGWRDEVNRQCPDCLGTKEWEATTPAGETFNIPCSTCGSGYFSSGVIRVFGPMAEVQVLTIGSVRIDTADERPVSYMCKETGIGTGTVWYEDDLFLCREEAMKSANARAEKAMSEANAREAERIANEKKASKPKPSWERRRIRELEKQLKSQVEASR